MIGYDSIEDLFYLFFFCPFIFSIESDDFYDLIPVEFFEKSYYRFKDPNIRKNMLQLISILIKKTIIVYFGKCCKCEDCSCYKHKENYYCYKCAPKKSTKMEFISPFILNGKFINDYSTCMDAFIYYAEKARTYKIPSYEIQYYRSFANFYLTLSTYMYDAPAGVYPRSSNVSDMLIIKGRPEIDPNPNYKNFVLTSSMIKSRDEEIKKYRKEKCVGISLDHFLE